MNQTLLIKLNFTLKIEPLDRWVEIHTSRVDYTTIVKGGFPNTEIRIDFNSSSGHDPAYKNRIAKFDNNGNLTFVNYCTQSSHSGSVDVWTLYYLGKIYKFTYHWYW